MERGSRDTMIIMLMIFVVLLFSMGAIAYSIYRIVKYSGGFFTFSDSGTSNLPLFINVAPIPDSSDTEPVVVVPNNSGDYSFVVGEEGAYTKIDYTLNYAFPTSMADSDKYSDVETGVVDSGLVDEVKSKEEEITEVEFGDLVEVQIPKIGIRSPILQGLNGDELLDQGWWLYPASYTNTPGEKILYCHRRYFGRFDPRTCWNLNQVVKGDDIYLINSSGTIFVYKVISISIVHESVTSMMRPSTNDYVKIITCGTENGAPGGNNYRLVVLGELQK